RHPLLSSFPYSTLFRSLVGADVGPLRVDDDRDAPDLAHLERARRELAACALRLLDRLVQVLDADVAEPVRRRCSFHRLAEAAVRSEEHTSELQSPDHLV